jgi:hypothetical protein
VYFEATFHVWFGYDILIYDNSNANSSSYSKLGYVYKGPDGCEYGNELSNNYLGGAANFMTKEIEVFKVIYD